MDEFQIMLNLKTKTQNAYHSAFIGHTREDKSTEMENTPVVCRGSRWGEERTDCKGEASESCRG